MKHVLLAFTCLALITSCGSNEDANQSHAEMTPQTEAQSKKSPSQNNQSKYMYELAINQSKEGQHQTFLDTRAKFVEVLGQQDETLNEGKWQPFFTVAPDMDLSRILVGMTHWDSMEGFGATAGRLLPQQEARNYFASFDPLAYALLQPIDRKPFDVETIKGDSLVVEFAIRKGKTADAFGEKRETFFSSLNNYDGYQFAREFTVFKLDENSMPSLAENTQAVIIVWENIEKFQAAATPIFGSNEYQEFAANLDVETYFATSPTK